MSDLLGPASAANAVTTRPGDSRTLGALDTWFKDCTSPTADDGTDVEAAFLNGFLANLRAMARINGLTGAGNPVVPETNIDGLLASALLHLQQRNPTNRAIDTGAVNTLVVSLTPVPAELVDGMSILIRAKYPNTGPTTLSVNGIIWPVKSRVIGPLQGREIIANAWQEYRFDLSNTCWQIASPQSDFLPPWETAGTFTWVATSTSADVEVVGAGGGGGGSTNIYSGAAGGGGGKSIKRVTGLVIGQSYTIIVGAGGTGAAAGGSSNGGNGGTSSFAGLMSATGGQGGLANTGSACSGGLGGAGSGGTRNYNGQAGQSSTGPSGYSNYPVGGGAVGYAAGGSARGNSGQEVAQSPGSGGGGGFSTAPAGAGHDGSVLIRPL